MTQFKDIPQPQDNRNQSQADLLANFEYLLDVRVPAALTGILPVDHYASGNNTGNPTDGFHKQISLQNKAQPVNLTNDTNLQASSSILYAKLETINAVSNSQLNFFKTSNENFQITPCLPMRVAVNFQVGASPGFVITTFNAFNIASVVRAATGQYTVNFTNQLPSANYIFQATACGSSRIFVSALGINYAGAVTNQKIVLGFSDSASNVDPFACSLMIWGF